MSKNEKAGKNPPTPSNASGKKMSQPSIAAFFSSRQAPPSPMTPTATPSPSAEKQEDDFDVQLVETETVTSMTAIQGNKCTPKTGPLKKPMSTFSTPTTPKSNGRAEIASSSKKGNPAKRLKKDFPDSPEEYPDDSDADPDFKEEAYKESDSESSEGEPEIESDAAEESGSEERDFKTPQKRKRGTGRGGKRPIIGSSSVAASGKGKNKPATSKKGQSKSDEGDGDEDGDADQPEDDIEGDVVGQHFHETLDWLLPDKRRDKSGVLHKDLIARGLTPRTLKVPSDFYRSEKVTPGQIQWWDMKAENFDCILYFKVGKFYEMYHMDADDAVREAGLTYMKGRLAHCGFPEAAFSLFSNRMVAKGYKIIRVEQMISAVEMKEKKLKSMPREIIRIHTPGTMSMSTLESESEPDLRSDGNRDASCLLSICEKFRVDMGTETYEYGVCILYPGRGCFLIGQFKEDRYHSRLRTLLAQHTPNEIILERGSVSAKLSKILHTTADRTRKEFLAPLTEFTDARKTIEILLEREYFGPVMNPQWPPVLADMLELGGARPTCKTGYELAIRALGGSTWYLKRCEVDIDTISLKNFELYSPADESAGAERVFQKNLQPKHMVLDGVTLINLDILPSLNSPSTSCLLSKINRCKTKFGSRLLKDWVMSPLYRIPDILDRQAAISDLTVFRREDDRLYKVIQTTLKGLPDLERLLSKVHILGSLRRNKVHPESRANMFDDNVYNKRKIQDFIVTIKAFESIAELSRRIGNSFSTSKSSTLKNITTVAEDLFPDLGPIVEEFAKSFNAAEAQKEGVIRPKKGIDKVYDNAIAAVDEIERWFEQHRAAMSKKFQCSMTYFGSAKNRYQLEIPVGSCGKMPSSFELKSQRKGFKRYWNSDITNKMVELELAEAKRQAAVKDCTRKVFEMFDNHYAEWSKAVKCLATLDVLIALEEYSSNLSQHCVPVFHQASPEQPPFIAIRDGHHPLVYKTFSGGEYIPNDAFIGTGEPSDASYSGSLTLVTGPNMGGKSTLMRQIGLITVLAQLGSNVPASSCELTPVDRIFTRIGASDNLLAGESTFFVELSETSAIIQHATQNSLVLVDELGRGTATFDGTAVAAAVLRDLATRIKCRTLFSTHYHSLVERFGTDPNVKLGHMACLVENENEDDPTKESITFLYKFIRGACPKSYGFNAAKLAGLPDAIVKRAHEKAQQLEHLMHLGKLNIGG
ncbi:DNA mismatch repair protein Msh6 [Hypsibius exemplaris]|uniref:DNA mismatch repair protein n=1 Tax=Hypsibius exemplaris TaxID=2072580 RepID=A0A1W0XCJ2_HYPEX|nr:DNA mismatch repair protein Msh6 [Hypsibius exemplaris]